MSTAELNKKKLDLIAWINLLLDETVIEFLDEFKNSKSLQKDWWYKLSDVEKEQVEKGLEDIEKGKVISSSDFWDKLKVEI